MKFGGILIKVLPAGTNFGKKKKGSLFITPLARFSDQASVHSSLLLYQHSPSIEFPE